MRLSRLFAIAALISPIAACPALAALPPTTPMLPGRMLRCEVGRVTNLDPARAQTVAEIVREGRFPVAIYLPPAPAPVGPPPDPADDPAPVDPQTRIAADPAKIFAGMHQPFDRVVDRWPNRVELVGQIDRGQWNRFIAITDIVPASGTASIFSARMVDAASMDLNSVYQGTCKVTLLSPRRAGRHPRP